ncbi:MAG: bifunctional 4-hydroxy-2-oxoglutarate aldolase/2-dehydro-3-deoxy-phosphogluconate aldolase [Oscillospiraceae bacterium]
MNSVLEQISAIGIVPVIRIDKIEDTLPLAKALSDGGLPCAEITFRTEQAEEAIRLVAKEMPEMVVGAGTVTNTDQVDRAVAAGAKFIVSAGLNPRIVKYCQEKGVPITPGTSNATDIGIAVELGLEVVKFFPAEINGGLKAIKALSAPYVNMKFMPTGGVNAKNLNEYLAFPKIIACGGSWMVDPAMVAAGDFAGIEQLTREAVQTMLGFEVLHVGINAENSAQAEEIGKLYAGLLGVPYKPGNSSVFAGGLVEVMRQNGRGKNGHIAIGTNSVARAMAFMQRKGFTFDESSCAKDEKGNLKLAYLNGDFGGFAVHLLQK